jgi:hypothetical protein
MDFIAQLPVTKRGRDAIYVVVDKLTKMVHIIPTHTKCNARKTALLSYENVWKLHGVPQKIVSDRGPQFISAFTKALCQSLQSKLCPRRTTRRQTGKPKE